MQRARFCALIMLALTLVLLSSSTASAAEGHEQKPGIFSWALDLGIWTLVVFLLLVFILRRFAWGPMLEGLKKREDTIRAAVEEAKHARAETVRETAEFKAKMDEAYAEIPKMMDEARRDAQVLAEEMRGRAHTEIQADRQRLRREIETARDQALKELQEFAANLATQISSKVLRRALTVDDHRRLVDEALTDLRHAGKGA